MIPAPEILATTPAGSVGRVRLTVAEDDTTVDMRGLTLLADQDRDSATYAPRPVNLVTGGRAEGMCVLGPLVVGIQGRDLGWEYLKHDPGQGDHPAVRIGGRGWTILDGVRVDNMMNGIRPSSGGLVVRNAYLHQVRDDCLANDDLLPVEVSDSLFDGCYTGVSARPDRGSPLYDRPRSEGPMTFDHVLIRLAPMPGGHNVFDGQRRTFGQLWKWSDVAGPTVIRDSVILVDGVGDDDRAFVSWPEGVVADDVVVVWPGPGAYPGDLPANGVTLVRDRAVWAKAREVWLRRHGCADPTACDLDRLVSPRPLAPPAPSTDP